MGRPTKIPGRPQTEAERSAAKRKTHEDEVGLGVALGEEAKRRKASEAKVIVIIFLLNELPVI